jgi:hypothetical protein
VAESFFHTLKTELIYLEDFDTHEQAQTAVFEYNEASPQQAAGYHKEGHCL